MRDDLNAIKRARSAAHAILDPIWQNAPESSAFSDKERKYAARNGRHHIVRTARTRCYAFLAEKMWLTEEQCHVSRFDVDQCHEAIRHLEGITYAEIRAWAQGRKFKEVAE